MPIFATVSTKTNHVCTKSEITFIVQEHSYTQELSMHGGSTVQCEWVCFFGGILPTLPSEINLIVNIKTRKCILKAFTQI